jgi:hypothetical protein
MTWFAGIDSDDCRRVKGGVMGCPYLFHMYVGQTHTKKDLQSKLHQLEIVTGIDSTANSNGNRAGNRVPITLTDIT